MSQMQTVYKSLINVELCSLFRLWLRRGSHKHFSFADSKTTSRVAGLGVLIFVAVQFTTCLDLELNNTLTGSRRMPNKTFLSIGNLKEIVLFCCVLPDTCELLSNFRNQWKHLSEDGWLSPKQKLLFLHFH